MNKKIVTRISSLLIVVAMSLLILAAFISPVAGESMNASTINKLSGVETNWEQYLSSAATTLPSTVKPTDEISVIIKLDNPALLDAYEGTDRTMSMLQFSVTDEAEEIRKGILADKQAYVAKLDKAGFEYALGANYDTVLTGFEVIIKAESFDALNSLVEKQDVAVVSEVYKVAETQLVNNKVDYYEGTGIFDSSDFGYDGSGMVVAVLDTGLDYTHSAFSPDNFKPSTALGLTKSEVAAILSDTRASGMFSGLSADDVYLNDKVPFSFDYADRDADAYSMHNHHGTHVSGVIVGKDDVITGVAPNAQLVAMKIFSDVVDTARGSWIIAALEDCVTLGVDVINMSLGTACGFSRESDVEVVSGVYERIRETGISLVVAASNSYNSGFASEKNGNLPLTSNPDAGTVGSPSTYDGALSVASIAGEKTPYLLYGDTIMYFVEATNAAQKEKDFFDEILNPLGKDSIDIEYVLIPGAGRPADYTGIDVTGKIALVRRGSNTFEEKANAAYQAGATGIIIYNNVAGDIKMNAGTVKIPICSISQDDGEMLAAAGSGTLKISKTQTSGPFISDFSSWGPTPSLGIKPEITAHGGNILSAVTAATGEDGYDRLSGTSMACPNMAGAIALMRQYVMDMFPEIADNPKEITATVNRILMSTTDIMLNKNGLPYAVRKQGAGLANLDKAKNTAAYILTYDRLDGSVMDKTKIELGDDPDKTGVYTLKFSVNNFGYYDLTYAVSAFVLTEGVSETKTHAGETTVTETAYSLDGAKIEVVDIVGGTKSGMNVTIGAGDVADITVRITLSDSDKKYLDESFENGMYVEGFVELNAVSGTSVGLTVPYLAFYGDWTQAPLFDLDYFETNKDELDDSIEKLDKTLPDAYATRPIGGLYLDYISYLGAYYFVQDPRNEIIAANREYVSLTTTAGDDESNAGIHALRNVYAGLLRNAAKIVVTITDDATGEVIFTKDVKDVRKSYGDGGSIYPANIEIEFDANDYNLMNNSRYSVKLQGYLDYGDGGLYTNEKNTFEFPITIDSQAPTVTGVEYYTEYDKDLDKMRLYAKIAVFDNHYAMSMQIGNMMLNPNYNANDPENNSYYMLNTFSSMMTPVYSERNSTSYVTYELTDYIDVIKNQSVKGSDGGIEFTNSVVIACYDYAMNNAVYQIPLPDDITDFYFSESEITLSKNEVFTLEPEVYPGTEWSEFLIYSVPEAQKKVVNVVGNKIVAVGKGEAEITVRNVRGNKNVTLKVRVLDEGDPGFQYYDKPVADVFELTGYDTLKAYYILGTDERDIGLEDSTSTFKGAYALKMFPSESVKLNYNLLEYFPNDTKVVFESTNASIVTVDDKGVIVAHAEGYAAVTVSVYLDGEMTYYSETVDIEVKDPFKTNGPILSNYYGNGGTVTFPEHLEIREIGQYAFSNYDWVPKVEGDEISEEDPSLTKQWFIGETTIKKVILPEGVEKIDAYAFAGLTALEEVVFPSTLEVIEYGAFYGCTSLKKITAGWTDSTDESGFRYVQLINKNAFYECPLTGKVDLSGAYAISDYAFSVSNSKNAAITEVTLPATLQSIGAYAFAGQTRLRNVNVNAASVKLGDGVFMNCSSLAEININTAVIPSAAFYGCTALKSMTIGPDVAVIGEEAFGKTAIASFTVAEGNTTFHAQDNGRFLLSADGTELLAVAPGYTGTNGVITVTDSKITKIGSGAFSGNTKLKGISIPSVTVVGDYAFTGCTSLSGVSLGELTYVGDYSFMRTAITELPAFADSLSKINKYAFYETKITQAVLGNGMTIGECAFAECRDLWMVFIGDDAVIESGAFMLDKEISINLEEYKYVERFKDNGTSVLGCNYISKLTSLTIGKNAVIGEGAFYLAAGLKSVTLGEGAYIGDKAFYNAQSLETIDLSKAKHIGAYAFSGDAEVLVLVAAGGYQAYVKNGYYVPEYIAAKLKTVDLSSANYIGERAFHYCTELTTVTLGDSIKSIATYAFANCSSLKNINLDKVEYFGECAFAETGLVSVDLSSTKVLDKYAFTYSPSLKSVKLGTNCEEVREGVFADCFALEKVENLKYIPVIGKYAFAYTAITDIDVSMATTIGDLAFMKQNLTNVKITLGSLLNDIGDNPFALCIIAPDSLIKIVPVEFGGTVVSSTAVDTYEITENVLVIGGSLYAKVPNGMELITYIGNSDRVVVEEGTVRISAYAFAGADFEDVVLPRSLASIGHKAFYKCTSIDSVIFKSYYAPILEEQYEISYFMDLNNIPTIPTNAFTTDGRYYGLGIVPYFMWGASSTPSNYFYGANFIDYIGHGVKDIEMVRPVNGVYYDTFIYDQYFNDVQDGAAAPDKITEAAMDAILKLAGVRVSLQHEQLVLDARAAYDKITSELQRSILSETMVDGTSLTAILTAAERRIEALKSVEDVTPEEDGEDVESTDSGELSVSVVITITAILLVAGVATVVIIYLNDKKRKEQK